MTEIVPSKGRHQIIEMRHEIELPGQSEVLNQFLNDAKKTLFSEEGFK